MEPRKVDGLSSCRDERVVSILGERRWQDQVISPEPADGAETAAEEEVLEAPERGSVDELLDAGAHDDHRRDAPLARPTSWPRPSSTCSRARSSGIGPAIADGFYYDFELPRPLTPADLEAIEARMRDSVSADHPFVRKELPFDDARAIEERRARPSRSRSSTTSRPRRPRRR